MNTNLDTNEYFDNLQKQLKKIQSEIKRLENKNINKKECELNGK